MNQTMIAKRMIAPGSANCRGAIQGFGHVRKHVATLATTLFTAANARDGFSQRWFGRVIRTRGGDSGGAPG